MLHFAVTGALLEPVGIGANQGPQKDPVPEPKVEKHVNEGPEKEPVPAKTPPIKVNPAREP